MSKLGTFSQSLTSLGLQAKEIEIGLPLPYPSLPFFPLSPLFSFSNTSPPFLFRWISCFQACTSLDITPTKEIEPGNFFLHLKLIYLLICTFICSFLSFFSQPHHLGDFEPYDEELIEVYEGGEERGVGGEVGEEKLFDLFPPSSPSNLRTVSTSGVPVYSPGPGEVGSSGGREGASLFSSKSVQVFPLFPLFCFCFCFLIMFFFHRFLLFLLLAQSQIWEERLFMGVLPQFLLTFFLLPLPLLLLPLPLPPPLPLPQQLLLPLLHLPTIIFFDREPQFKI